MSLSFGNTSIKDIYYGSTKIGSAYLGSTKVYETEPGLPPFTLRLKFTDGVIPGFIEGTGILVDSTNNIWDLTYENGDWTDLLSNQSGLVEVIGGNTAHVRYMSSMFEGCTSLTTVSLFNTSNVTEMDYMFSDCYSLTAIPLFDTTNVSTMIAMFYECHNVQSGALALYQQASTQTNPPHDHDDTFTNCGSNTQTGSAELAQIPSSWGGTGA